jgi:hypothetical protein
VKREPHPVLVYAEAAQSEDRLARGH